MRKKVTLKQVILSVKLSLLPIWCWPQPADASKLKMFCVKLHHYICIFLMLLFLLVLIYSIRLHFNDDNREIFVNIMLSISSTVHPCCNFLFYLINHHHIQVINIYLLTITLKNNIYNLLKIIFIIFIDKQINLYIKYWKIHIQKLIKDSGFHCYIFYIK